MKINQDNNIYVQGLTNGNGLTDGNGLTNGNGLTVVTWNLTKGTISQKQNRIKNLEARIRKNRIMGLIIAIILIITPLDIYLWELNEGHENRFQIDGKFKDWGNLELNSDIYSDQKNNVNINIINYHAIKDNLHYNFYLQVYGSMLNGVENKMDNERLIGLDNIHIFLDSDNNLSTGYSIQNLGADYVIEIQGYNGMVLNFRLKMFEKKSDRLNWCGWRAIESNIRVSVKGRGLEAQIPIDSLSNPISTMLILFHTKDILGNEDYSDEIINLGSGILSITQESTGNEIISKNSMDNAVTRLTLQTAAEEVSVNSLVLTNKGTICDAYFDKIELYLNDENFSTARMTNNKVVFDLESPILIAKYETITLDVKVNISSDLDSPGVLGLELKEATDISIESEIPIIIESDVELKYIDKIPNNIIIDGAFADWGKIPYKYDTDLREIKNENIDIDQYRIYHGSEDFSFYFKVDGTMLGGTYVPINPQYIKEEPIELESSVGNVSEKWVDDTQNEVNIEIENYLPPSILGEDSAFIFLDTDLNEITGFQIGKYSIGADYLVQIKGKNGYILESKCYEYNRENIGCLITDMDYQNWDWRFKSHIPTAIDSTQLETKIDLADLGLTCNNPKGVRVFFYIEDWNKAKDKIDEFMEIEIAEQNTNNFQLSDNGYTSVSRARSESMINVTSGVGNNSDDRFGWNVSFAGDINNDGYNDIIVGAPYNDTKGNDAGAAYIFFGCPSISLNNINASTANVTIYGVDDADHFGWDVSFAGNLDNDAYDDIIIGAPGTDNGTAYIFYGAGIFYDVLNDDGVLNANNEYNVTINGSGNGDQFGYSVSDAGDVNNDSYHDVIVGAPGNNNNTGASYIFYGGNSIQSIISCAIANVTLFGNGTGNRFGASVSSSGDVNNDGFDDVIIGSPVVDRVDVYYGSPTMDTDFKEITIFSDDFETDKGWTIDPESTAFTGDWVRIDPIGTAYQAEDDHTTAPGINAYITGQNSGGVGDDDVDDGIAIGRSPKLWLNNYFSVNLSLYRWFSTGNTPEVTDEFKIQVSDDNGGGWVDLELIPGTAASAGQYETWNLVSFQLEDYINLTNNVRVRVSARDDVGNADYVEAAIDDVILNGTPYANLTFTGKSGSNFGFSVSGAGDFNKDGYDDVLVGAPGANQAYIYYGGDPMNAWVQTTESDFDSALRNVHMNITNIINGEAQLETFYSIKAMMAYFDDNAIETPRNRSWNQITWLAENSTNNIGNDGNHWFVIESGTVRKNEKILTTLDKKTPSGKLR